MGINAPVWDPFEKGAAIFPATFGSGSLSFEFFRQKSIPNAADLAVELSLNSDATLQLLARRAVPQSTSPVQAVSSDSHFVSACIKSSEEIVP